MNYEIKKGDRFLCLKDYVMYDGETSYVKGKIYLSEMGGCITDEYGSTHHVMSNEDEFFEYFEKLTDDRSVSQISPILLIRLPIEMQSNKEVAEFNIDSICLAFEQDDRFKVIIVYDYVTKISIETF